MLFEVRNCALHAVRMCVKWTFRSCYHGVLLTFDSGELQTCHCAHPAVAKPAHTKAPQVHPPRGRVREAPTPGPSPGDAYVPDALRGHGLSVHFGAYLGRCRRGWCNAPSQTVGTQTISVRLRENWRRRWRGLQAGGFSHQGRTLRTARFTRHGGAPPRPQNSIATGGGKRACPGTPGGIPQTPQF